MGRSVAQAAGDVSPPVQVELGISPTFFPGRFRPPRLRRSMAHCRIPHDPPEDMHAPTCRGQFRGGREYKKT
jgi:hypothetical protein